MSIIAKSYLLNIRTREVSNQWSDIADWEEDEKCTIFVDKDGCLSAGADVVFEHQPDVGVPAPVDLTPELPAIHVWAMMNLPRSVYDTFCTHQTVICEECFALKNLEYNKGTGELIRVFCQGCRRAISCQPGNECEMKTPMCQKARWVDELGDVFQTCRGCCPGQIMPRLPECVPEQTRKAFERYKAILCSYCVTMQNFEFDEKGGLTRAFCPSCQIRIAQQPGNECEGGTARCQKVLQVDGLGKASETCRGCAPLPPLPDTVPGPTRAVFDAHRAILCSHCITMKNFKTYTEADKKTIKKIGELVAVFCPGCQIRIARQPGNECAGDTPHCQKFRIVDGMGKISALCKGCHQYGRHCRDGAGFSKSRRYQRVK